MPTYEYQCFACGHHFEAVQRMSDDPIRSCPKCNQDEAKRLISPSAFHLKGSGWYKTDYGNGKVASSNGTSNSEAKASETKTETSCASGSCGGGCSSDD